MKIERKKESAARSGENEKFNQAAGNRSRQRPRDLPGGGAFWDGKVYGARRMDRACLVIMTDFVDAMYGGTKLVESKTIRTLGEDYFSVENG